MYCSGESKICVSHFETRPLIKRQLSDLFLLGGKHKAMARRAVQSQTLLEPTCAVLRCL